MAGGQQTYGDGGFSIAGLIEHLGREAARLNTGSGAAPFTNRSMYDQPAAAFASSARRYQIPGALVASPAPQEARYGQLYAPPANDLSELRRQQAAFARKQHEIAWENKWLAAPALAPVIAPFLAEGGAAALGRGLAKAAPTTEATPGPLFLTDRETWQRAFRQAYTTAEKNSLRRKAGQILARANGIHPDRMMADVHHSEPLAYAHLKSAVDPNRLSNLWALRPEAHVSPTREWNAFTRSLQGRDPTPAELMREKLRVDQLVAPYIRRGGVPRSNKPRWKGGPI